MELNICHLYPDLLNVYGDVGNILILKHRAELRGIKVNILNNSLNDAFNVDDYDIVLFGGGQDFEQSIVSNDLSGAKKDALEKYIEAGKVLIAICGGYQLLGKYSYKYILHIHHFHYFHIHGHIFLKALNHLFEYGLSDFQNQHNTR